MTFTFTCNIDELFALSQPVLDACVGGTALRVKVVEISKEYIISEEVYRKVIKDSGDAGKEDGWEALGKDLDDNNFNRKLQQNYKT